MKTKILFTLFSILLLVALNNHLFAQQGAIEHNSGPNDATLELIETQANDFSRLFMTNSNVTDSKFSLAAKHTAVDDADFGLFYNGLYRFFYEESDKVMSVRPRLRVESYLEDNPVLEMDIDNDNNANITFVDNQTNPQIGRIKAFTNQNGSAIPSHISYMMNDRTTGVESNVMSMWDGYTTFSSDEIVTGGAGRVIISHDSDGTDANLRLIEKSTTDYARIGFTNQGSSDYFNISARPGNADPELTIAYNGIGQFYVIGDEKRIGIMDATPVATLHVKQQSGDRGFLLENDGDGNDEWAFDIGTNDLGLYRDGVFHGAWDDATLGQYGSSDRRLKNSIEPLGDGMLDVIDQLEASKYYFNHDTDKSRKAYGFIAQDVQAIMPELVKNRDTDNEDENDLLMLNYTDFTVISVKAIQELNDLVRAQAAQLELLKNEVAEMKANK